MDNIQFRITPRLLLSLTGVERLAGHWEATNAKDLQSETAHYTQLYHANITAASVAALCLDSTTPANISSLLPKNWASYSPDVDLLDGKNFNELSSALTSPIAELDRYIAAHEIQLELKPVAIFELHRLIVGPSADPGQYRKESSSLVGPNGADLFVTTSAFMVDQRLNDLCQWVRKELSSALLHPLIVIGIFQLLFVYIYPFKFGSHRLGLILTWHLLKDNGYEFVRYGHFIPEICRESKEYSNALIQAEKSLYGNWATLPVWLEYFTETLRRTCRSILDYRKKRTQLGQLTSVQRLIVEVVQLKGAASRDAIARETGINVATVKYNLTVLTQKGRLRRHGGGRTTSYSVE